MTNRQDNATSSRSPAASTNMSNDTTMTDPASEISNELAGMSVDNLVLYDLLKCAVDTVPTDVDLEDEALMEVN